MKMKGTAELPYNTNSPSMWFVVLLIEAGQPFYYMHSYLYLPRNKNCVSLFLHIHANPDRKIKTKCSRTFNQSSETK